MKPMPVSEINNRLPEIGRIRLGKSEEAVSKQGKAYSKPMSSDVLILSSQYPEHLETMAPIVGGTVEEWRNDKTDDTHRLITETDRIEVAIPPDPLSGGKFERWEGNKRTRMCDGVICTGYPRDGGEPVDVACLCQGIDDSRHWCKLKTHFVAILPQCPIGGWRLTTTSINALAELQMSIDVLQLSKAVGLHRAWLISEFRSSGEKEFRVPVVRSMASLQDIEAAALGQAAGRLDTGETRVDIGQGAGPTPMALPAGAEVIDIDTTNPDAWEG